MPITTRMKVLVSILLLCFISIAAFSSYVVTKREKIIAEYYRKSRWNEVQKLYNRLKKKGHTSLFFGDSITANFTRNMPASDSIVNMGIGGDFTRGLIWRIDNVIHFQPDNLFIMVGINDLVEKVPLSDVEANYEKIIDLIQAGCPNTTIYVQSTFPTYGLKSTLNSSRTINIRVRGLNAFLEQMCVRKNIHFINLYPDFVNEKDELRPEYQLDGVHLSRAGNLAWVDHIKKYLN